MPQYAYDRPPVMLVQKASGTLPTVPTVSLAYDRPPSLIGNETTEAQLFDPGITYNEPGITYNEPGLSYGGVYGAQDKRPTMDSFAPTIRPSIIRAYDETGTNTPPAGNSGMLIGMLGLTYP